MSTRPLAPLPTCLADLNAPGGVEQLLAFHRALHGDARMEDDDSKDDDPAGGDGDGKDDDSKDDDPAGGDGDGKDDDAPLGPKGEKALEAEKTKRRTAQAALREFRDLGLTPAELKKLIDGKSGKGSTDDGDQPDVDRIKSDARTEAARELQRERVLDKIEAKAARGFADPDDAAALLLRGADINDFLDDDGKIDVEAIEDGLKALLEKKPYLGVAQSDGKRFKGGADGGARKDSRPTQLTRDDLTRMSPQAIEKARTEGRLADLLSGKK